MEGSVDNEDKISTIIVALFCAQQG